MSRYKHVTKRERARQPWQVMIAKVYIGSFAGEEDAAKAAAKHLGVPKKSLLRNADDSKTPKRTHQYVYWHKSAKRWQVKIGSTFMGIFDEHKHALKRAVEATGLQAEDLRLDANAVRKSLQGQRHAVLRHMVWFRTLYLAYSEPGPIAYPGDLVDMMRRATHKPPIMSHPNFIVPMLLAKYGPHRDALHDAFMRTPKLASDPSDIKWTYLVIVAALVSLNCLDDNVLDPWRDGPGTNAQHHSGLIVYSNTSLKILIKCDAGPPPRKKRRCVFGKGQEEFLIQPYSHQIELLLKQVREFGLALLKAKPPTSLEEWTEAMSEMTQVIKRAPGIPKPTSYRYKWVVRGFWDYQRHVAGIEPGITFPKDSTVIHKRNV